MEESFAHVRKVDDLAAEVRREREATEADVRSTPMDGTQFTALGAYTAYLKRSSEEVQRHRRRAEAVAEEHRLRVVEAERRVRMIEKLEAKARGKWQAAADRELEEFAAEAYLSRWK